MELLQCMKVLLICNRPQDGSNASTINDHLHALNHLPGLTTYELSTVKVLPSQLDLDMFDAIIIHYTTQLGEFSNHYLNTEARTRIGASRGVKVAFIQDEYREASRVHDALQEMNVTLLYTLLSEKDVLLVYPKEKLPNTKIKRVLAAYVPERLLEITLPPIAARPILVSYRARKMPVWLGSLAVEKWQIAVSFLKYAEKCERLSNQMFDISWKESHRVYGKKWYQLLMNSKCVLGVESGANVLDVDGQLRQSAEQMLNNGSHGDDYVYENLVKKFDNVLSMNQIAARHFEACALGTVQVLFEGNYSHVLVPDRHYISLKKDFSNFPQVVDRLLDDAGIQSMANCARKEIAESTIWSYKTFSKDVSDDIATLVEGNHLTRLNSKQYSQLMFKVNCLSSASYLAFAISSSLLGVFLRIQPLRGVLVDYWHSLDAKTKRNLRPFLSLIGR